MKKIFFLIVLLLVGVGIYFVVTIGFLLPNDKEALDIAGVSTSRGEMMKDKYFYSNNFYKSIDLANSSVQEKVTHRIKAAIIPHDVTQGQMIANLLKQLATQKPKRIILLGPNHYESGRTKLITTLADWETKFGLVSTDDQAVDILLQDARFSPDTEIIENEHSVSAIVPYIAYYLPETQVVPIIFKADLNEYEIIPIVNKLDEIFDNDTVVIAAVDFSHYLSKENATRNDAKTLKYLQELDYQSIFGLGTDFNDYLDSPAVIGLLLKWLTEKSYSNYQMVDHTNSANDSEDPSIPSTSYFEIIYY